MEVRSMRLDHGPIQTNNMSYPQRQPQNHRPNHSSQSTAHVSAAELYKSSRSPLSNTRCTYPPTSQLQPNPPNISQVQVSQRYPAQGSAASITTPAASSLLTPATAYHRPQLDYRHTNRISLLHPEYGPGGRREAASGGAGGQPPPTSSADQPLKKIRLTEEMQSLRIDIRPGTYTPQVEAISPTYPEPISQEDQVFKTTKDRLIQQISKVDREILKAEQQIVILKKKQAELEEVANKPTVKKEIEEDAVPKNQSLPQKIYAENRRRAQSAHALLDCLGPKVEWPLYNQPTDTTVFHENNRRNVMFKKRLLEYFKKKHAERHARNNQLAATYSKLMQEWIRKCDKIESSTKRKVKEAKNREFFEKTFPEVKRQRENKERFNRVGSRVKSEVEMDEFSEQQEQDNADRRMRSYAVIPPILLDPKERRIKYTNNNNFVEDMEEVYQSRQYLNIWTAQEKETFKEKYLQHPKNFYQISQALGEKKSVSECVRFYYLSKKTENYKRLLRKNRRDKLREKMRQSRNSGKINNNANLSVVDNLSTGVTTRLQREQQQRTEGSARSSEASTSAVTAVSAEASNATTNSSPPPPALGTTAALSPLNVGGTTTSSTTASTSTSNTNVSSSEWTGTTITSTAHVPTSVSQPASTTTTTPSSSAALNSPCPSSPLASSVSLTTTSTTTTSTIVSSMSQEVSNPENDTSKDAQGVKFNDFNSFEDFNNRKKVFGENLTGPVPEKQNDFVSGEQQQNDKEIIQDKLDGESTSTTSENVCDPSASNSTPTPENKKKKERRKENSNIESSDEEAASMQDKNIQGTCAVCNAQLGPQLHSRPLQPSQAAQYGLREEEVPHNSRVCNTCRCKCVRSRYTHCPLPNCPNGRGRVKRLRSFPYRLQDLPSDVRDPILAEFRIPSGVTKCCSACFIRIQRRLGPVEEWPDEEVNQLKGALTELGANWQLIGERLNKLGFQVRSFYAANRKRLNLEVCLGDRKPTLTDEEESGSSTSSCEEPMRERERHSSDTTSAAESPPVLQGGNQNAIKKEDYDSSATETADEAQTDHYQAATITPVCNDYQSRPPAESPLSVKELMMDMIERSLSKTGGGQQPGPVQGPGITPTISSILNSDANEVTIVSEYNLNSLPNRSQPAHQSRTDISITKLANTIGATITPVSGPIRSQPEPIQSSRDDLVVVQVPDNREPISETLDLSIKKPREPMPPTHPKHIPSSMHRSDAYMYHAERKSPFVRNAQVKMPNPQPANPKAGSITLGTPIINQPTRYDALLRQTSDKMGSITKGTPIHPSHSVQQDKRMFEYYPKQGRMPSQPNIAQQPQYQYAAQRTSYDQQINSQRKLIFDDYMTSQQMQNRRPEKPQYYATNSSHRTPPPQQQSQQRQGVIQRHTRPQYHPTPPGHEALSTLVELSVQQPSLPVPTAPHEGLGKSMADNIMEQPHRLQLLQHQQQMRQQQQRIEEQRRAVYQQQQQQHQQQQHQQQQQQARQQGRSDPSTMTAASLIDAIITHQINQTAEAGRGDVVPNSREPPRAGDLLFQGFQRDPPVSQDNGLRASSIINVDLDNEVVNKNLTVKELTDSVISHDFSTRPPAYYHMQETEQWKRRLQAQQHQKEENKRSATPQQSVQQQQQQQQDERQIIRIAQPQKYHHEPLSPPETNHWSEQNYRRYQQPPSHMSPLDYVKNRIVEVMRTEDDKKEMQEIHPQDKDRSVSPGDMVIDEEKHENEFGSQQQSDAQHLQARTAHQQPPPPPGYSYSYVHKDASNDNRGNEPKPLLSAQYEPLSDED